MTGRLFIPVGIRAGGVLGISVTAAALFLSGFPARNDAIIAETETLSVFEIRVGDCFDDGAFTGDEVLDIPTVPCTKPHDNEVYAKFAMPGDEWPGDDTVDQVAMAMCYDRFRAAIGKSYEDSAIDFTTMYPSERSWNQGGDREIICIAFHMDLAKLTETVRGSGI